MPITYNFSFHKDLTIRIISINGILSDSFSFENCNKKENLTIIVQVLYNNHNPIKNADVTIFGYGDVASNKTNVRGITKLHLNIDSIWRKDTPEHYLSAVITKGNHFKIIDKAIEIIYSYGI